MSHSSNDAFHYQLVLLCLRDPARFATYCELVAPVVEPYGGALDVQIHPTAFYAEGVERPDVVNLVHYSSRETFQDFIKDQRFREIVHLRASSVGMVSVEGPAVGEHTASAPPSNALYLVEIARLGPGGAAAYQHYEREAEPIMAGYGYHVARVLRPASWTGLEFAADVVKVAYFESADGLERLHADPEHARIEAELYPAAVAQSIRIVGKAGAPSHELPG